MEDYIQKLKSHDWYHVYSDDHRVYTRGRDQRQELYRLQVELDPKFKVWNTYAPEPYMHKPK
tara:strand:+ start:830 stop:1015 length:186 start_codon:yes stop_codon:yes gene_type:complete